MMTVRLIAWGQVALIPALSSWAWPPGDPCHRRQNFHLTVDRQVRPSG